jgi:hypothetical protein
MKEIIIELTPEEIEFVKNGVENIKLCKKEEYRKKLEKARKKNPKAYIPQDSFYLGERFLSNKLAGLSLLKYLKQDFSQLDLSAGDSRKYKNKADLICFGEGFKIKCSDSGRPHLINKMNLFKTILVWQLSPNTFKILGIALTSDLNNSENWDSNIFGSAVYNKGKVAYSRRDLLLDFDETVKQIKVLYDYMQEQRSLLSWSQ